MEQMLIKVFKYYKKKYNLDTLIDFRNRSVVSLTAYYDYDDDIIFFDIHQLNIAFLTYKKFDIFNDIPYQKALIILLHELNHAIEREKLIAEWEWFERFIPFHIKLYRYSFYADNLPFERRANNFALKELSKWT